LLKRRGGQGKLSGKESRTGNLLKEEKDRKFKERRGGQKIFYEGGQEICQKEGGQEVC